MVRSCIPTATAAQKRTVISGVSSISRTAATTTTVSKTTVTSSSVSKTAPSSKKTVVAKKSPSTPNKIVASKKNIAKKKVVQRSKKIVAKIVDVKKIVEKDEDDDDNEEEEERNVRRQNAEMIKPRNGIPGLELEVAVLKKLQRSPHFARYVDSGEYKSANYLIMQLL
uniref:Uncharacterized protein n=1 Tax=Romanomermis culicivorax TaxID=13658 RepID=A0A915JKA3_ROMCU